MGQVPISLDFAPGIQRDGTQFDGDAAVDALWCRWRLKRARKMGGYQRITAALLGLPRRIHVFYQGATAIIHIGTTLGIQQVVIDYQGNFVSFTDRTPATGFTPGQAIEWTLDSLFDTNTGLVQLIAHAAPNANQPSSTTQTVPFLGPVTTTSALVQFSAPPSLGGGAYTAPNLAGGIVSVQPYTFGFDANGLVQWSAPNIPLSLGVTGGSSGAGSARPSAQKIVAGAPLRSGGTQQPALLLWSLSEVIYGNFVGSSAGIFSFSTVSPSSSILSSGCVIEDGGLFFWPGVDRFYVYNGAVQELKNDQNQDWFFDNLNWDYVGKVQAFKIPRYGEICWLAPMFGATECSHMIVFNKRENVWYDTALPDNGRACGYFAQGLRWPIMAEPSGANGNLWLHEIGTDKVVSGSANVAVRSYFETPILSGGKNQPPTDKGISYQQFEPDIAQSGDMSVYIIGSANTRSPVSTGTVVTLPAVPAVPQEQLVSFKEGHRQGRLHIESNVVGGNYVIGKCLLHAEPCEPRITG